MVCICTARSERFFHEVLLVEEEGRREEERGENGELGALFAKRPSHDRSGHRYFIDLEQSGLNVRTYFKSKA